MTTKELLNGCKKRMSSEMVLEFQLHTLYKCLIAKKEFPFKDRFNINKMIQLNISSLLIHWNCQEAKNLHLKLLQFHIWYKSDSSYAAKSAAPIEGKESGADISKSSPQIILTKHGTTGSSTAAKAGDKTPGFSFNNAGTGRLSTSPSKPNIEKVNKLLNCQNLS